MNSQELRNLQEAYLDVYGLDEGTSEDVAARAQKLANQRKEQTPERKRMYQNLALNARIRASGGNPGDKPQGHPLKKASNRPIRPHDSKYGRSGLTQSERDDRRDIEAATRGEYSDGPGTKTKNPKKLRKQKAMGELKDSYEYDLYDIILSHLIDEGYADTEQAAEAIMVNMSEDWRESIMERREHDEPGEDDRNPDVISHNRAVGYKSKRQKYGSYDKRDRGGSEEDHEKSLGLQNLIRSVQGGSK